MNKTTLSIDVYGDSYDEIIDKAEQEVNDFLGVHEMPIDDLASYEVFISRTKILMQTSTTKRT